MNLKIAALAGLLSATSPAFAGDSGVPVLDPYSGTRCFKFWLKGNQDQYAINPDSLSQLNMIQEVRAAAYAKKSITIFFWDDALLPLQDIFPRKAACYSGDGQSLKFYETPINVQVNQ